MILIVFLGNYLINNVVAALVSLIPASSSSGIYTPQYITFAILAALSAAVLTWWFFKPISKMHALQGGITFGVAGFIISILTTFVSGIAGVLAQSGSFAQVFTVLPNFGPFLWNPSTIVLFLYWVIPGAAVGYYLQMKAQRSVRSANVSTS